MWLHQPKMDSCNITKAAFLGWYQQVIQQQHGPSCDACFAVHLGGEHLHNIPTVKLKLLFGGAGDAAAAWAALCSSSPLLQVLDVSSNLQLNGEQVQQQQW
jgi:hypothetical protein